MIAIGVKAPEFALKDQNGKIVKLSALKGKKVLLYLNPWPGLRFAATR